MIPTLIARLGILATSATAVTAFMFLMIYSLAGVGPQELDAQDGYIMAFIWAGSLFLSLFAGVAGTVNDSNNDNR